MSQPERRTHLEVRLVDEIDVSVGHVEHSLLVATEVVAVARNHVDGQHLHASVGAIRCHYDFLIFVLVLQE